MGKYMVDGIEVLMRPANPLEKAQPPIPPVKQQTVLYKKGSVNAKGAMPLPLDIECVEDLEIPLRDGTILYGDLYRAAGSGATPVILVYSMYSKRGGPFNANFDVTKTGFPAKLVSGLQKFEAPDPAFWCLHGYSIFVVDARGIGHSGGDLYFLGSQSGRDVYDVIEWSAKQPWSTGKTTMMGNSQLAMIQWAAAAECPPHLTAIAPWEGLTDEYRDTVMRGGIPNKTFHDIDIMGFLYGQGEFEDITGMLDKYPLMNAYWQDKIADLEKVTIPAYVVASWTHSIHTKDSIHGFERLASKEKWLRIHNTHEWGDLDTPENCEDLCRFFDHYLKGEDNGWEKTPRVRYAVLDPGEKDTFSSTEVWPLPNVRAKALHLNAADHTLSETAPVLEAESSYDSTDRGVDACVRFEYKIPSDMVLTGPSNVRFWVDTSEGDDLDLFATYYIRDAKGRVRFHVVFPYREKQLRMMIKLQPKNKQLPGGPIYVGPNGRLRVSHRGLDKQRSTDLEPVLTHTEVQPVKAGEPVQVDLGLWPVGMKLHAGETLILEIAGHACGPVAEARASDEAPDAVLPSINKGRHTVHTGGKYDSVLLLPVAED